MVCVGPVMYTQVTTMMNLFDHERKKSIFEDFGV